MSALKKLLVASVGLLLSLCGYATISQADTTVAYYQQHGNFQPEKASVAVSSWDEFASAYANEAVTKIVTTKDIEDTSRNGLSGPTNYQRKASLEIDGQGHILTLKQYHGLRTSAEATGYTETIDGVSVPRSIFHMHDISLRQNVDRIQAAIGNYSSFAFVGASDVHASWGLESAKYEQNMTKNWYFRFGNIDTKYDDNKDNAKGVARLVMAYSAEVSVYGQLDLTTSAENMYVGSLIVEDGTNWVGTVSHYNYSTVWFAVAGQPASTGRSEGLTIGKNSQITFQNIKHGSNFPGFYGHYKAALIGENAKVSIQNKGVAWQFEQDGSSLTIQSGAKLSLNSEGSGKVLQFGRGFLSPSKIKDSQLTVKTGGSLIIEGKTDGHNDLSVIDFSGGTKGIASRHYSAINSKILVEVGATFDVKNTTKSKRVARRRAINLRHDSNQLHLENNTVSLWSVDMTAEKLENAATTVFKNRLGINVKGELSQAFKSDLVDQSIEYQNKSFRRVKSEKSLIEKDTVAPTVEIKSPTFVDDYTNTQERKLIVQGTAHDNTKVKAVTYKLTDSEDKVVASGNATGTVDWQIPDMDLALGINKLVIESIDVFDNKAEVTRYIKRLNDELTLEDNVIAVTVEEEKELTDQFVSQVMDDNETPGYIYDDQLIMTFKQDNVFAKSMSAGILAVGKIVYFDHSDYMPGGYTGKLVAVKPVGDKIAYHFTQPELVDVFKEDISLDYDQKVDMKNDILYTLTPAIAEEKTTVKARAKAKQHGVDKKDFFSFITPEGKGNNDAAQITIGNDKEGLVLYDMDGDRTTKHDQVSLLMSAGIKDFRIDTALEWKKALAGPEQIRFKTNWRNEASFGLKLGGKKSLPVKGGVELTKVVNDLKEKVGANFQNEMKFATLLTIKGVDSLNDSIVLGFIGVNMNPLTKEIKVIASTTLEKAVEDSGKSLVSLTPTLGVMTCLDIKGNIELSGSALYKQSNTYTKGINIQKSGYIGKGGSAAKNNGDKHDEITFNKNVFNLNYYDSSTTDKGKTSLDFEGSIKTKIGGGPAIGLLINGIIPVSASAKISTDLNMKLKETITLDHNDVTLSPAAISADVDYSVNRDVGVEAKIAVDPGGSLIGKYINTHQLFYLGTGKSKPLTAVLTWKKTPRDLDSHVFAPDGQHLFYGNKMIKNKNGEVIASLNYDYTGGFGPEETKIYPEKLSGNYQFRVKQYSGEDHYQIKKSKAQVKIKRDGTTLGTFTCPDKGDGDWWHVFDYDTKKGMTSIDKINTHQ